MAQSPTVPQATATAPAPLPTPAIAGPLQAAPAMTFAAGPLGKLELNGVVSGIGLLRTDAFADEAQAHADFSNAQIAFQKTTGWWQFFVEAGAYDIPILGTRFTSATTTASDLFGYLPVAYLKLAPAKNTSVEIGVLPTLMGAEYNFTFQNMNIERGLLWNQENDVNRGIQINQSAGKFTASLSWNDGFYSNRYTWLTGMLAYSTGPHTFSFAGGGNYSHTAYRTTATTLLNNSRVYDAIYSYAKSGWTIEPYLQYTSVPTDRKAGIVQGAATAGAAALASRSFKHGLSLAARGEYIASTGSRDRRSANLLYGPGSSAWSATATPTYQSGRFFLRGEFSLVHAIGITPGDAFGSSGNRRNQPGAAIEMGFLF